jgi:hypothetical protein
MRSLLLCLPGECKGKRFDACRGQRECDAIVTRTQRGDQALMVYRAATADCVRAEEVKRRLATASPYDKN